MNSTQFNILLGALALLSYTFVPTDLLNYIPTIFISIFLILLYVSDYFAFKFKVWYSRVTSLIDQTQGKPELRVGEISEPGCMLYYAFLIRFVFRVAMLMSAVIFISGDFNENPPVWAMILISIVVLFELYHMLTVIYDSHIFRIKYDEEDKEEMNDFWSKEIAWRKKAFEEVKNPKIKSKLTLAHLVLIASGSLATTFFWDGVNDEFVSYIVRAKIANESAMFVIPLILISCAVLCFFYLLPVRLAFWLDSLMHADTEREKRNYRLSILFAAVSITAPTLIQLLKSYFLGYH